MLTETNKNLLIVRQRCRYNQLWLQKSLVSERNKLREGVVVGESLDGKIFYVLWDGRKTKESVGKVFLEILNSIVEEQESNPIKLKMIPPPQKELPLQFSYLPDIMEEKAYKLKK